MFFLFGGSVIPHGQGGKEREPWWSESDTLYRLALDGFKKTMRKGEGRAEKIHLRLGFRKYMDDNVRKGMYM